jgi:hypothetical protein
VCFAFFDQTGTVYLGWTYLQRSGVECPRFAFRKATSQ